MISLAAVRNPVVNSLRHSIRSNARVFTKHPSYEQKRLKNFQGTGDNILTLPAKDFLTATSLFQGSKKNQGVEEFTINVYGDLPNIDNLEIVNRQLVDDPFEPDIKGTNQLFMFMDQSDAVNPIVPMPDFDSPYDEFSFEEDDDDGYEEIDGENEEIQKPAEP